ncbi:uncharacterized protein METZ01_LOCUS392079, partial [marine metagenome]
MTEYEKGLKGREKKHHRPLYARQG